MIIDGKFPLNPYTKDIDFMELVDIGDMVVATEHGTEFNLTENKHYKILGYSGDCIYICNDLGIREWYSVDYFHKAVL